MQPYADTGHPDYRTIDDLEASSAADSMGLDEAVRNLVATVDLAKAETEHEHR